MDRLFSVAVFCGLYYTFAGWRPFYIAHSIWLFPLTCSLPIGLLMGDVQGAIVLGATISTLYVGLVATGAEVSADTCGAGLLGTAIGLSIGADTGIALLIAVPFGILGLHLNTWRRNVNEKMTHSSHKFERFVREGNEAGIRNCAVWWPLAANFITKFVFMVLAVVLGVLLFGALLEILPQTILVGLSAAGKMLPAAGFAIMLHVFGKKSILPFFFLGFFAIKLFHFTTLQLLCIGGVVACAVVLLGRDIEEAALHRLLAVRRQDDEDDDEDDEDE